MLSEEIDLYLKENAYCVQMSKLSTIIKASPQITSWTFDVMHWMYVVRTNDGYSWKVRIYE